MTGAALIDPASFRRALGHYPTGVCVIAAKRERFEPIGMTVGTFTSVSLDPPLVGFLPAKSSTTWPHIRRVGRFCANILSSDQADLCGRFSSKAENKFEGVKYSLSPSGQPVLVNALAWIDCTIDAIHEVGDHDFVVGQVHAHDTKANAQPLLFFRGGYGFFAPLAAELGNG